MRKCEERESIVLENKGQKIFGVLHRPLKAKKSPVVLICHGLAGHKTGKHRIYVLLAERLSQNGIASLRIDFRGSGDSEGEFIDATIESEVSDAIKGVDFLLQAPYIDYTRIGIFGRSAGGMIAIMTAKRVECIKSIATWAPLFDGHQWLDQWQLHHVNLEAQQSNITMRINGQVPGYELFKQLFNIKMIEELKPLENVPFLNIHGDKDIIVSPEHANRFKNVRQEAQAISKSIRMPQSDHDFSHPEEQETAISETCQWFLDTLSE